MTGETMRESTRPLRVVAVTHTGETGGAETALLRLIQASDPTAVAITCLTMAQGPLVARLRRAGISVRVVEGEERVLSMSRHEATRSLANLWTSVRGALTGVFDLRRALRQLRPDVAVANSLKAAVFLSLAAPLVRVPWVWHLHDRLSSDYLPAPLVLVLRALARLGPRRVVVNSRATGLTLGRATRHKTVLAYPGLDRAAFDAPRDPGDVGGAVGIVGRVSETKGQRLFLAAAELVGRAQHDVTFRIVGGALFEDAPVEAELRTAAASSSIAARLHWTGWVDDVAGELRKLRLAVHASPVPEPFGQVVVEAMAAGVPVIATRAGGVPEILDPDGTASVVAPGVRLASNGLLVEPGDVDALARAITWALDHPQECSTAALVARSDAGERFRIEATWHVVAAAWTESARGGRLRGGSASASP
jgi:glycosyltransferase involved in cell wall biosynthesis